MKFRCERDTLRTALDVAARTAGKSTYMTRVCVAGDRVTFTATDLDLTVEAAVEASGDENGETLIPAAMAASIVAALRPGAVEFDVTDWEKATITSGRSRFELHTAPPDTFPAVQWLDWIDPSVAAAKELAAGLRRVVPAVSTDQGRPQLCGVRLESPDSGLRIVGTDSYRLSIADLPNVDVLGDHPEPALVPGHAVSEIVRVATPDDDIEVRVGDQAVQFNAGPYRFLARLIEGEYPRYGGLVPAAGSHKGRLIVPSASLADAAKQARLLTEKNRPIRVSFAEDDVTVAANSDSVGAAHVAVEDAAYEGVELTVGFNPQFLLDTIDACPGDMVQLDVIDGRQPVVVRSPGDDSFVTLLMPVRVSEPG